MAGAETKRTILVQLDGDDQPSVFDAVVAVDAGVDVLLRHAGVRPESARELVYGAIFTRGSGDLSRTAIFIGGSDVTRAERLLEAVRETFWGPMRVSVMIDPAGANTTAAAAVLAAAKHVPLGESRALVLGSTGPVGRRLVQLLAAEGAEVRAASRQLDRARAVCEAVAAKVPAARLSAWSTATPDQTAAALEGCQAVIAAGAPGVTLLPAEVRRGHQGLRVAIDLNAVRPAGIEGIEPTDRGEPRDGVPAYGPIGVGGVKMKLHKAALRKLFTSNELVLDAAEIVALGRENR
jgi:hypothetical protein